VQRLGEVPGLGVDSAPQIIAEVGATAATFPAPKQHKWPVIDRFARFREVSLDEMTQPLPAQAVGGG
jgi:hypothetical protein